MQIAQRALSSLSKQTRAARARSVGQSPARSAAAAQHAPVGLHPGRDQPLDGGAAGLRIRSRVRPAPGGQSRGGHADQWTAAPSFSRPSTTCFTSPAVSTKRRMTRPSAPMRSRCSTRLKELHLILAQGAHNQFGDLPWTARVEMLIQKWLLARPEIREFLGGAPMVPYKESWMAHADSMKTLQGWTRCLRLAFPRPRRFRRADSAVRPLRGLEQRRCHASQRQQLGHLLAPGNPVLHPLLSSGDRR